MLTGSVNQAFSQDGSLLYPEWQGTPHLWRTDESPDGNHGGEPEGTQALPFWREAVLLHSVQQHFLYIKLSEGTQAIPQWRKAVRLHPVQQGFLFIKEPEGTQALSYWREAVWLQQVRQGFL